MKKGNLNNYALIFKRRKYEYREVFERALVNFINAYVRRAAFTRAEPKSVKETVTSSVFLRFWDLRTQKLCVNVGKIDL